MIQHLLATPWFFALLLSSVAGLVCSNLSHCLPQRLARSWREESISYLKLDFKTEEPCPLEQFSLRRFCIHCLKPLPWLCSLHLFGYLIKIGKCPHCSMPLLRRKFVIELTVFVLTFGIILNYGINLQTIAFLCFSYLLITQVAIDAFHQILPDEITYILLWLGLCQSLIPLFTPSFYAITGACFGYLFFYVIAWIFKKCTQKDGLGHGDFKLLAALGAWVGLGSVPLLVLFAGITALIGGLMRMAIRRDTTSTPFPFGPYLALSGWAILFLQSFYPALFSRLLLCLSLA